MQIGFFGFLGLAFIVLKLMKIIDWAWVWVLAPIWGGAVLTIVILVLLTIIAVLSKSKFH